ncbi:flagellar biosynthesis regulator FlaF [Azospirillum sp. SYSU D00513]|uniref:flagellar biosynthesis regulator FlaF n=1 Tax=Azospirillum sp. SYSU D00513 TaxID=2812561 RepID=UPI001A95E759|nr:flagellar biosynthesis regulator FlaF [Azospirillum sp. SYSU D00513]
MLDYDPYAEADEITETPRDRERRAFYMINSELAAAKREVEAAASAGNGATLARLDAHRKVASAIERTRTLWNILLADIMDPQNRLPQDTRKQIAEIGIFTWNAGNEVLGGSYDRIDEIIDVHERLAA